MKNTMTMVLGTLCVGLRLLLAQSALGAGTAFAGASGPQLVPDYDRDGEISNTDRAKALASDEFTIWINDDDDGDGNGDTDTDLHDVPCGKDNDKDCEDEQVNGRCDLLDFFPVLVNVHEVRDWEDMTWKLCSDSVNVVFTQLVPAMQGVFIRVTWTMSPESPWTGRQL